MENSIAFEAVIKRLETSRPLIERLYKQNTLTEVMNIMESQHGLKASLNMYKKRINKWGLDKKNKEGDMKAIIRKERQRKLAGKSSVFRARSRSIKYEDVVRYWERRRMSIGDVLAMCNSREATPDGLECSTPLPSPVSSSAVLTLHERILRQICDYSRASFQSGTWVSRDPKLLCFSIKDSSGQSNDHLDWFTDRIGCAAVQFRYGKFSKAGQTLRSSIAIIEKILVAENPYMVPQTMQLFHFLCKSGYLDIGMAIIRQMAALGELLLCQGHPIPRIFGWLATVDPSEMLDVSYQAQHSMVDLFESLLGFTHSSTLDLRRLYWSSQNCKSMSAAVRGDAERYEAELGVQDPRCMQIRSILAAVYFNTRQYDEAENECWIVLDYCNKMEIPRQRAHFRAAILYILGEIHFQHKNVDAGAACLKEAIALRKSIRKEQDSKVMEIIVRLEYYFEFYGMWESAAQVEQWRMAIMAADNKKLQEMGL